MDITVCGQEILEPTTTQTAEYHIIQSENDQRITITHDYIQKLFIFFKGPSSDECNNEAVALYMDEELT